MDVNDNAFAIFEMMCSRVCGSEIDHFQIVVFFCSGHPPNWRPAVCIRRGSFCMQHIQIWIRLVTSWISCSEEVHFKLALGTGLSSENFLDRELFWKVKNLSHAFTEDSRAMVRLEVRIDLNQSLLVDLSYVDYITSYTNWYANSKQDMSYHKLINKDKSTHPNRQGGLEKGCLSLAGWGQNMKQLQRCHQWRVFGECQYVQDQRGLNLQYKECKTKAKHMKRYKHEVKKNFLYIYIYMWRCSAAITLWVPM